MGKKGKMAVLKRQRELKKLEKAALKRERRERRSESMPHDSESQIATKEDLAGYGFDPEEDEDSKRG